MTRWPERDADISRLSTWLFSVMDDLYGRARDTKTHTLCAAPLDPPTCPKATHRHLFPKSSGLAFQFCHLQAPDSRAKSSLTAQKSFHVITQASSPFVQGPVTL